MSQADLRAVVAPAPLRKQVVESLREAIVGGQFRPGQRLLERALCDQLGVSRTSLREGLVELEAEGLIEILPNRGPIVPAITVQLAEEVYQARAVLEALSARLFVRNASDAQRAALREAFEALVAAYQDFSPTPFLRATGRFYRNLLEGAGNRTVIQILRGVRARVSQLCISALSDPARRTASLEEIRRIMDAVERRDEDVAWQSSLDHVTRAAEAALHVLREAKTPSA